MTPEKLEKIGKALFGEERWKSPLATALGVNSSSIRAIMRGDRDIPQGWTPEIKSYLEGHIKQCQEALDDL
ncbi:hypothetical protein FAI40_10180 [Acetobacteraceae bacterium]|nr:hypothetical protein FAI40_10180 [Acetobacteraceae bacterium]